MRERTSDELTLGRWREELTGELRDNILGYWIKNTVDRKRFGFVGEIKQDGRVVEDADKGLVLHARILWTFSAAYRTYRDDEYAEMARRAYAALREKFWDDEFGGLYWMIAADGRPTSDKKQVYGQAFVIYGLAEFARAVGGEEAKQAIAWAGEIYRLLEKHAYDPVHLGYVEALARDWSETDELSLSGKDLNERKSMNTHLHVLEAYTNLYRVWKPEGLRAKLKELIEVHLDKIIDAGTSHFLLFFDDEWQSKTPHVSYGHDIEGSWLLWEAAEVLGDESLLPRVKEAALAMARATLEQGVDKDGGVYNEFDGADHLDDTKDWWPQAEAMVGFLNAYQLSGKADYLEAAKRSWTFIRDCISDREGGEWHWQVTKEGVPVRSDNQPKVGAWKCPYHNSRACFEALERIKF
ncbi:AGE family epimerase/isomerase [Cohnella fermenti]|uniref:Cellobiose 2-epimerase n=1 Tax=Cohnella fermenti TaxID=2565925 RepID=A0A4S4BJY0_9BACL|nr:AGE family epimerase/isomerase [Cohnella fermenti]THF75000.1 N-acyl-D-glucosamine 2-epimerase [Cohnella fermenti]